MKKITSYLCILIIVSCNHIQLENKKEICPSPSNNYEALINLVQDLVIGQKLANHCYLVKDFAFEPYGNDTGIFYEKKYIGALLGVETEIYINKDSLVNRISFVCNNGRMGKNALPYLSNIYGEYEIDNKPWSKSSLELNAKLKGVKLPFYSYEGYEIKVSDSLIVKIYSNEKIFVDGNLYEDEFTEIIMTPL